MAETIQHTWQLELAVKLKHNGMKEGQAEQVGGK
jgi:hypothetical protein